MTTREKKGAKELYRPLITNAIRVTKRHLAGRRRAVPEEIFDALHRLKASQDEFERHRWADVRLIHCGAALLAEYMICCITQPRASAHWGYQAARQYAEQYDARYGTGLIPASADSVEDIAKFWRRYQGSQKGNPAGRRNN